ncbi:unnamed protein product [Rodentolepis nana]|uniref:Uncharacterized protein n=1 Tax=Rodentolepis nana TaxID=102285 RepID=A0A3P7RYD3_RODNA|nr:unnamed protein product [Rodentolepis nana]
MLPFSSISGEMLGCFFVETSGLAGDIDLSIASLTPIRLLESSQESGGRSRPGCCLLLPLPPKRWRRRRRLLTLLTPPPPPLISRRRRLKADKEAGVGEAILEEESRKEVKRV